MAYIIAFLIAVAIILGISHEHHGQTMVKPVAASLSATSTFAVINPATLRVFGEVHNNGGTAYAPSCTIHAHDAVDSYDGLDIITDKDKIEPGKQWNFGLDLIITNQGASYITAADISCK